MLERDPFELEQIDYDSPRRAQSRPQPKPTTIGRIRNVVQTVGRFGDLALSIVAPAAAYKRSLARAAFTRGYDAIQAQPGNRLQDGYSFSRKDADTELNAKRTIIAAHSREEVRNNGWVKRAERAMANNVCGDSDVNQGIDIRPLVMGKDGKPDEEANKELAKFWKDNKDCIEYTGRWGFSDILRLWMNSMTDNGEFLSIIHDRPAPGGTLNFSVEVLEPDRMPTSWETVGIGPFMPLSTINEGPGKGNYVKHSIEYKGPVIGTNADTPEFRDKNGTGQIVAIYVLKDHPGNEYLLAPNYTTYRVPWDRVLHVFEPSRPEQTRGVSRMVAGLQHITDLRELVESELTTCRVQSTMGIHFEGAPNMPPATGSQSPAAVDGYGRPVTRFEPGMVTYGPKAATFYSAQRPGSTFNSFVELIGRLFASAVDMPYSIVTGDYSKLSFSSLRQEHHEFRRSCRTVQGLFVRALKKRLWPLFVRAVAMSNQSKIITMERLSTDRQNMTACHVETPQWEYVNPQQEAAADSMMLANGLKTHEEIPGATAMDPMTRLRIHAATKELCEELKLNLPCFAGAKAAAPDKTAVKQPDSPDKADEEDAASAATSADAIEEEAFA